MLKKGKFDYILLETTGLAGIRLYFEAKKDPGPIASMFWVDEALQSSVYLDGVITVVDSLNIERSLSVHDNIQHGLSTAHLQISHADVLLVNKVDLVSPEVKSAVLQRIRSINAVAKLYETEYAHINLDAILDLHAYDATDFSIEDLNRDSSGHLDHVCHPQTCLTTAYLHSIIQTSKTIEESTGEKRCLDTHFTMGGNTSGPNTVSKGLHTQNQRTNCMRGRRGVHITRCQGIISV